MPANGMAAAAKFDELDQRLDRVERRQDKADDRLDRIIDAIGEEPAPAQGIEGSGMLRSLSRLVAAEDERAREKRAAADAEAEADRRAARRDRWRSWALVAIGALSLATAAINAFHH